MTISQVGRVRYSYFRRRGNGLYEKAVVYLTLVSDKDEQLLDEGGMRALRLQRILRITKEAEEQGVKLGYEDLSVLLLTSLATLKRDISSLEASQGELVPLRGRRKRMNSQLRDSNDFSASFQEIPA